MDRPLESLARHFHLPETAHIDVMLPFTWLRKAVADIRYAPAQSLAFGVLFALLGWVILAFAADKPYLFVTAMSAFMLLAPILAAGLYEISRCHEAGSAPPSFGNVLTGLRRNSQSLSYCGIMLALVAIAWERISAILFALLYGGDAPDFNHLIQDLLFSGDYLRFVVTWTLVGALLAALVFALTAVSIPMMVDRDVDVATATMTSFKAVANNLLPMAVWAAIIVVLMAVSFATYLVGLIVLLPLLGHATWHAYRALVH